MCYCTVIDNCLRSIDLWTQLYLWVRLPGRRVHLQRCGRMPVAQSMPEWKHVHQHSGQFHVFMYYQESHYATKRTVRESYRRWCRFTLTTAACWQLL